jgi:2,4-dienoyl-CoA reductase-like NADH-dependent reductase (Old Yellow Enzyme family)
MTSLFEPITIKTMTLKNRIVFPPIATNYGLRNERALAYYTERARGGAGLVILQGTPVDPFASPKWVGGLKPLVDSIHQNGAAIGIQLWMGNELPGGDKVAPSPKEGYREITAGELGELMQRFAVAARAARDIGFDTIDVHGAHGYFLHQLFSPLTNRRSDAYGGNVQKRMAFGLECARAIRKAVGSDYPVMYRLSAIENTPGGIQLADSVAFGRELAEAGVDVLDVSAGSLDDKVNISIPDASFPFATHVELAATVRSAAKVPVVAVGRFNTREICEKALAEGKADLIAIGRQLLADPYWPNKVREGREADVVECDSCNAMCTGHQRTGKPIECVVNPDLGQEYLRSQSKA